MAAVTIHSDSGTQENKICYCIHFFPFYSPWVMRWDVIILVFWMLNFKPAFSPPDTCTTECHFHLGLFILFGAIIVTVLCSSPIAQWTLPDLRCSSPVLYLFVFSYCSWGSWGKNTVVGCHFLLWWSTFVRTLHFDLSWIALLDMAHSFTELCKAHHHEKWPMKGGRGATHTTLPSRMAYEVFSKFFKYSESRWASSKKSLIFLLLLKIISATDLKKKIAEISVLYVLMENWVNNLSYWFKKKNSSDQCVVCADGKLGVPSITTACFSVFI